MNLAATVGWRIPHTNPLPPAETGVFGFTSGGSDTGGAVTPTLPPGLRYADALVLFVMYRNEDTFSNDAVNWPQIASTADSSGGLRLRVIGRIATGTSADALTSSFSVTGGGPLEWAIFAFRVLIDDRFPLAFAGAGVDWNAALLAGGIHPAPVSKVNNTTQVSLTAGFFETTDFVQGADLISAPAGYTYAVKLVTPIFLHGSDQFKAQLGVAYRVLTGSVESPGAWGFGTGNVGGGGEGGLTLVVSYTP